MTSYEILDIIFLFTGLENLELMGFMDIGNGIFQIHFCTQQEFSAYKFSQIPIPLTSVSGPLLRMHPGILIIWSNLGPKPSVFTGFCM